MDRSIIENELILFLKTNVFDEAVSISPESDLKECGMDSFSIVEIILFLERKFSIVVEEDQLLPENFQSVQSIAKLVHGS